MYSEIAYLITDEDSVDDNYDVVRTPTKRKVFVEEKSIKRNEFYQAHATGLRPEIALEMQELEYNKEDRVEFEGVIYNVLKTYKVGNDRIELTLIGLMNEG